MSVQLVPESAVLASVIDILIMRYRALVLRINSGVYIPDSDDRFVQFYFWQALGLDKCRAGVSDVLALLPPPYGWNRQGPFGLLLAVECKSPDRRDRNGQPCKPSPDQARFLAEVESRGGLAIVCDDVGQLEDELQKRGY